MMVCRFCGLEKTERNQAWKCPHRIPTADNLRPRHEWFALKAPWKPLPPEKRPLKTVYSKD